MGGSNGNSNSKSPFVLKTHEMVDEPSTNSVVSWSASGISFVVLNPVEFSRDVLPKYFKHNNFSSFIRQLNTYGFRKVDPHQWEFANEEFVRGKGHLLKNIHRRKPSRSHANAVSLTDEERQAFLNTIENLEKEKRWLQSELERHKQENRECQNQLNSLGQTLQNINQRQEKLMGSLDRLLEEPGHYSSRPLVEHQNKKRRLLALQHLSHQEEEEVNHGVSNLSPSASSPLLPNLLNLDLVERLDSYLTFWDKFIDEIPESYGDLNDNYDDCRCSPEVAAATCDSPLIPSISIDPETGDKSSSSGVDVSTVCTEQQKRDGAFSVEANDFFWQQFLTEAPDASVGKSDDSTKDHSGLTNYQQNKPWWIHVDHNHTQQMMENS